MRSRSLSLEAEIAELSPGGDGVAICVIDGERRAVFVSAVASGERVRLDVDASTRPARGRLLEVITPSASRVASPCAHVARCGGCDWMHLAPIEQAAEHARIVARLLGAAPATISVHPAVHALGYRTRARVHLEAKRRGRQEQPVVVGMFARQSHEPAAVDTCVVLDPILDRVRGSLGGWLEGARGRGEAQLALSSPTTTTTTTPRLAVIDLTWKGDDLPAAIFGRLEQAVKDRELLAGVRVFAGDVRIPATIGDPTPFVIGADGEPLRLGFGGFAQANDATNALLARRVAELARGVDPGPCVELYAGAGNLTILLARDREEITAVEHDKDACAAARANLSARGLTSKTTRIVEGDAARFAIPKNTKLVVLDPPREGARAVAEALAATPRARRPAIIYVACDPPTLARDVKTLKTLTALGGGGYTITSIDTFEMFPQTSHVETVVVLSPQVR